MDRRGQWVPIPREWDILSPIAALPKDAAETLIQRALSPATSNNDAPDKPAAGTARKFMWNSAAIGLLTPRIRDIVDRQAMQCAEKVERWLQLVTALYGPGLAEPASAMARQIADNNGTCVCEAADALHEFISAAAQAPSRPISVEEFAAALTRLGEYGPAEPRRDYRAGLEARRGSRREWWRR